MGENLGRARRGEHGGVQLRRKVREQGLMRSVYAHGPRQNSVHNAPRQQRNHAAAPQQPGVWTTRRIEERRSGVNQRRHSGERARDAKVQRRSGVVQHSERRDQRRSEAQRASAAAARDDCAARDGTARRQRRGTQPAASPARPVHCKRTAHRCVTAAHRD